MRKQSRHESELEVWLDCDLGPSCLVGILASDRGQVRFHYDRSWLRNDRAFSLDPDLSLGDHAFFRVQDVTRQGALRVRLPGSDEFLGNEKLAAPPVTSLRELESVAYQLSSRRIDDLDALRRWLAVLVAPGASLGGARPKANFTENDGSLWIGKFPAHDDERDVGAWEYLTRELALRAGSTLLQ